MSFTGICNQYIEMGKDFVVLAKGSIVFLRPLLQYCMLSVQNFQLQILSHHVSIFSVWVKPHREGLMPVPFLIHKD